MNSDSSGGGKAEVIVSHLNSSKLKIKSKKLTVVWSLDSEIALLKASRAPSE